MIEMRPGAAPMLDGEPLARGEHIEIRLATGWWIAARFRQVDAPTAWSCTIAVDAAGGPVLVDVVLPFHACARRLGVRQGPRPPWEAVEKGSPKK